MPRHAVLPLVAASMFASGCAAAPQSSPGASSHDPPAPAARTVRVPAGVVDLAIGARAIWVAGFGEVTRLDPRTGVVVARIRVLGVGDYSAIAAGDGSVWVTAAASGSVYRIDLGADRVVARIRVGGSVDAVTTGAGSVWVARVRQGPGNVVRIDPRTNRVVGAPITVGPGPEQLFYRLGAVWVQNTAPPSMMRIDPRTGRVTTADEILAQAGIPRAQGVAFAGGAMWAFTYPRSRSPTVFDPIPGTAALWELSAATGRVVAGPIRLAALEPDAIAASARNVCIGDYLNRTVTCVHPPPSR